MKKSFLALASFAAIAVGCQVEKMTDELPLADDAVVYKAVTEAYAPATKTAMDGLDVVWSEGDLVAIYQGNVLPDKYVVSDGVGETTAEFTLHTEGDDYAAMDFNLAVYPYDAILSYGEEQMVTPEWDDDTHMLPIVLPSTQVYTEGSFANGSFPMVAVTESVDDDTFEFKNAFGAMKLQLKGTKTVKSVIVSGANSEVLAGQFIVMVKNGIPSLMPGDYPTYTSVTVDCEDGITLKADEVTEVYISLPPTTFDNGFTVTLVDTDYYHYVVKAPASENNVIERSKILVMPELNVDTIESPVNFAAKPGATDAEISISFDDEDVIGFYGIYSSAEYWAGFSPMFAEETYFNMLISGSLFSEGMPCYFYQTSEFEGNLTEFGVGEAFEYINMIVPGTASMVVIIPVYEGKDTYTLDDAIVYEVRTSELTVSGTMKLPEYSTVPDYETITVNFEASSDIAYMAYRFFKPSEQLPTSENCLEEVHLEPQRTIDGGYTMTTMLSTEEMPGTTRTLCVVVADSEGNAQLHTIENLASRPIPYNENLSVSFVSIDGKTIEYVNDAEENKVCATVSCPTDADKLFYIITESSDTYTKNAGASGAKEIGTVLNAIKNDTPVSLWKSVDVKSEQVELSWDVTDYNQYVLVDDTKNLYLHVFVVTEDGSASHIVTSDVVSVPGLLVEEQ